jgi:tetratricopeptide (TPR) repeat protein
VEKAIEILQIIISWKTCVIVGLFIFRKPLVRLLERIIKSNHAKAKVGPSGIEIDMGKVTEQAETEMPRSEGPKAEEPQTIEQQVPEEKRDESLQKVFDLLVNKEDYTEAQRVFHKEVEPKLDGDEKLLWQAVILRFSHKAGDTTAFDKLKAMARMNSTKPQVIKQLALRYKEMKEFNKAREKFLLAKDKYDASDKEQMELIIDCYIEASWCLALDNNYNAAVDMLKQILTNSHFEEQKAEILGTMANISKDRGLIEEFISYAEASLSVDPLNTHLRFNLAYAYSDINRQKLALLHYKKLMDITKGAVAMNNLGVCYSSLKLKGKSITSFFKSAEENETLAMGNLAHNYLEAGFINDARKLIDKANTLSAEGIEVNPRVGSALQRNKNLEEEENETEKKLLKEAEQEREFRVKYSEASLINKCIKKNEIEGPWKTPWGELKIDLDEKSNSFQIKVHQKVEMPRYATFLGRSLGFSQADKLYEDRYIKINGNISALTGKYKIQIDDKEQTTLMAAGKIYDATGYMIINETFDLIDIMEKTTDDKTEFKQWKKVGSEKNT